MHFPQGGLPASTGTRPSPGYYQGLAHVLRAYPADWRCDLRDVTRTEVQLIRARVIGPIMPPEHRPGADPPQRSFVLYGFNGGRKQDAWCIPVTNKSLTSTERENNQMFLRLLGIDMRIGKDGDDTVFEIVAANARILLNLDTGNAVMEGADGSAKMEIESGGKVHISCKSGSTVEADDGTGAVVIMRKQDFAAFRTAHMDVHAHTTTFGPTGIPTVVTPPAAGTSVLKGK